MGKNSNRHVMKNYTIGRSEIATVCGLNKYKTPFQLWEEKIGQAEKFAGNSKTEAGELFEPIILSQFKKVMNIELHREQEYFKFGLFEYCICKVDAISSDNKYIISAKNTSMEIDPYNLPEYWTAQLNWEMGVSGIHSGYITWLSRGNEFGRAKFEFDAELFQWQLEMAVYFVTNYLNEGIAPPPINSFEITQRMDAKAMPKELHDDNNDEMWLYEKIGELKKIKEDIKNWTSEQKDIEEEIKMFLVEYDTLTYKDKILCTWKQNKDGVEFDKKEFEATYPDIFEQFCKPKKGARVLLMKYK